MATRTPSSAHTKARAPSRSAAKAPSRKRAAPTVDATQPSSTAAAVAPVKDSLMAVKAEQSAKTDKIRKTAKPAKAPKLEKSSKAAKPAAEKAKKPKLVRDSFTIPKPEYEALAALKLRAAKLGQTPKKSELLRAGLMALAGMSDAALLASLAAVPAIKTGRPTAS